MRVIAGAERGITLKTPEGLRTRPTAERVKEGLFSAIQFEIPGTRVLDLFAGTGQLGIEALSRGARDAVFVDMGADACRLVRENLQRTGLTGRAPGGPGGLFALSGAAAGPLRHHFSGPALCRSFSGKRPGKDIRN